MRAIVVDEFGPPEQLRVAEVPPPRPGPGEVLVEVHAAPVNYVDLLVVGGTYQSLPARPFIPGKGPAGVVTALGPDVITPRVGDRVLAMAEEGGYAEIVALPADQCYCLPPRMSFLEAASLSLVYDTAWFALRERARLAPGETVLVLGASGGVGQAAVQLARAMGARVLAGIPRPEKAAAARAAGADGVIDLSRENLRDALREQVWAATERHGADIILDPLGGDVFDAALRALAWCGRLVVIGFAAGGSRRSRPTTSWSRISRSAACRSATIASGARRKWRRALRKSSSFTSRTGSNPRPRKSTHSTRPGRRSRRCAIGVSPAAPCCA